MKLITFCAAFVFSSLSFADTTLLQRTYNIKASEGAFNCTEPIMPNGHNFPVQTTIRFALPSYDLVQYGIYTNMNDYFGLVSFLPCSHYEELFRQPLDPDLTATVTQTITERYTVSGNFCMKIVSEGAVLKVGEVTLRGATEFLVGPLDVKTCKKN
jgi:hypothetical protein